MAQVSGRIRSSAPILAVGVAIVLLLAACGSSATPSPSGGGAGASVAAGGGAAALNGKWTLTNYTSPGGTEQVVPAAVTPSIEFDGNAARGYAGCNTFTAIPVITGQMIHFDQVAATKVQCPDPGSTIEAAFLQALSLATQWDVTGDTLTLSAPGAQPTSRFAAPAPDLLSFPEDFVGAQGTSWPVAGEVGLPADYLPARGLVTGMAVGVTSSVTPRTASRSRRSASVAAMRCSRVRSSHRVIDRRRRVDPNQGNSSEPFEVLPEAWIDVLRPHVHHIRSEDRPPELDATEAFGNEGRSDVSCPRQSPRPSPRSWRRPRPAHSEGHVGHRHRAER